MIYPFAIEPELVAQWGDIREFRFFIRAFGLGQPRLLAEFPRFQKWRSMVLRRATITGVKVMDFKRVEELVKRLGQWRIPWEYEPFDGNITWLENAEAEHERDPFHAILAEENPRKNPKVLVGSTLGANENHLWDLPRSSFPDRKASEMAAAVYWLLRFARKLVFIDPYFRADKTKWSFPLGVFLNCACSEKSGGFPPPIELHVGAGHDKAPEAELFREECHQHLTAYVPPGFTLKVMRWKQRPRGERLHDRHILTDLGGVSFGIGLDEGYKGETVRVTLMDKNEYEKLWQDYCGKTPAFDLADKPFELRGRGS